MSGGSYDYLYLKDMPDALQSPRLPEMAKRLREAGLREAAVATDKIIADAAKLAASFTTQLQKVWQEMEWYESNDHDFNRVLGAYADFLKFITKT